MAKIRIVDLWAETLIGTNEDERIRKQKINVNLEFEYDATDAIERDSLAKAIDYEQLCQNITNVIEHSNFFLVEALAGCVLDIVMEAPAVKSAHVTITKKDAIHNARAVQVELSRSN